ncbi:cytochrome b [Xanthobacter autotrophicus]|uniref:cytochrome b n=1 Tax=Xanthobacter autotrophicus TaxID=280 RepID=UPI0024A75E37|nr:cytochrome b [Xanthobacter autotrophicus]MDI4658484.1 cytochrome b [Xanthobacter autotrophicus]
MSAAAAPAAYVRPARWLHWIMAVLVLSVIPAGFIMMNLPSGPAQDWFFDLHRSIGFTILCLAVLRVVVRILNPPPPRPANLPFALWLPAEIIHYILYTLLLVMPPLGWLASNAFGSTVSVFGLFNLPNLVSKDDALADLFGGWHQRLAYLITALVILHIAAGLWHGIIKRDGVLSRMLPHLSRRQT